MSDFAGHFVSDETVLHNLVANAERNSALLGGRTVRVIALDWAQPDVPQPWWPLDGAAAPQPCGVEPVDVLLATECIYSEEGAALLAGVLARWLRRGGRASLLNNARRAGVARFERACAALGLVTVRLPVPEHRADEVMPTFAAWSTDEYVFWDVTWGEGPAGS